MFNIDDDDAGGGAGPSRARKVSEAERIINDLRQLRQVVIHAWHERSVMLTKEERRELQREVRETCDLLNELTSDP